MVELDHRFETVPRMADVAAPAEALRRRIGVGGMLAAVATAAALCVTFVSGTNAAALPILATGTVDATAARTALAASHPELDYARAHALHTPGGTGYVVGTKDGQQLCLVLPDEAAADHGYGVNCAPTAAAAARGLTGEVTGDADFDPDAYSLFVVALPQGATDAELTLDGRAPRPAHVTSGVVVEAIRHSGTLRYRLHGAPVAHRFDGPFQDSRLQLTCPGGRTVFIPVRRVKADMDRRHTHTVDTGLYC